MLAEHGELNLLNSSGTCLIDSMSIPTLSSKTSRSAIVAYKRSQSAKYPDGEFSLVPDAFIRAAVGAKLTPVTTVVAVMKMRRTFQTGELAALSYKEMNSRLGGQLTKSQFTTANNNLLKYGLLEPVLVEMRDGSLREDRSQEGHVASYRFCDGLWDSVEAKNKLEPDNEGSYAVHPSVGDANRHHYPYPVKYVEYDTDTYTAVPHMLLSFALKKNIGMRAMFTLLRLIKYVNAEGSFACQAAAEMANAIGASNVRFVNDGIAELKNKGIIVLTPSNTTVGKKRNNHAHYGRPNTYCFMPECWDLINIGNANKELETQDKRDVARSSTPSCWL